MSASRFRLPIRHHGQMKSKKTSTVIVRRPPTSRPAVAAHCRSGKFADQRLRHRPFTKARSGVEVTHLAEVDEAAAPVLRHLRNALEPGERIVAARPDDG